MASETKRRDSAPTGLPAELPREKIAVVVPCYNASQTAFDVLHGLDAYAQNLLAVDDGSTDDTARWLTVTSAQVLRWPENRGKGHALVEGFRTLWGEPGWEVLLTVDSDGQHAPEDLPNLVKAHLRSNLDIVVGRRDFRTKGVPLVRRLANVLSSRLIRTISGLPLTDIQCGYRLFTRDAVRRLFPHLRGGSFETETDILLLAHHLGLRIGDAPVRTTYSREAAKKSSWRAFHHSRRILGACLHHYFVRRRKLPGTIE